MTITAKYAATCATCRQPIHPGAPIEWTKGQPARHTACGAATTTAPAAATGSATELILGDTYPVRDRLRALGGRWDAQAKGWRVPADRATEARALVSGARQGSYTAPAARAARAGRWNGCACGARVMADGSLSANACWTCRHDYE